MRKLSLVLLSVFILGDIASTQSQALIPMRKPITIGYTERIRSLELGEDRELNIYFPEGYSPADTGMPVIYLLDGGLTQDFVHIAGVVQYLSTIVDTMPKCIIVGIANTDRSRDMTFPTRVASDKQDRPMAGGSEKFIAFIEKEVQPYIRNKYITSDKKVLVGHSLGGLLATEILLKKPKLFSAYIIVSPSLWWSAGSLLTDAPRLLAPQPDIAARVFISRGSEGKQMENDVKKLYTILTTSGKKSLKVTLSPMTAENPKTILHNAVYKGFEVVFAK